MKLIYLYIVLLTSLIISCKTEIVSEKDVNVQSSILDYEIINGIVHFRDGDAFLKVVNKANKDSFQINDKGFKSFYQFYKTDRSKISEDSSLKFTSNFIKMEGRRIGINFTSEPLSKVCNRDGLVYVGEKLMKFTDTKEFIFKNGNVGEAIKVNNSSESTDNVIVFSTENELPGSNKQARAPSLCRKLSATSGANDIFTDCSIISVVAKKMLLATNENDQFKVYFNVIVTGEFDNTGIWDGSSDNNELQSVFTLDIYDPYGSLATSNSHYNYSTSKGTNISYTSPYFYGTTCYSFQHWYTYANFREGNINPLPDLPCSIANCRQTLPIYKTDKHTVVAACTNSTTNN